MSSKSNGELDAAVLEAPLATKAKKSSKGKPGKETATKEAATPSVADSYEGAVMDFTGQNTQDDVDVIDLVIFSLEGRQFGVEITRVQEVVRYTEITRVPHAPRFVIGVMNLRGNITPVIDLHKRFELSDAAWSEKSRIIVQKYKDQAVGYLVDQVAEILHVREEDIERGSVIKDEFESDYITGIVKVRRGGEAKESLILMLDLDRIFEEEDIHLN